MDQTDRMIIVHPVVETCPVDGFTLWPAAELEPYGFLHLSGALGPLEVGTAVMSIANCNDVGHLPALGADLPPRPPEPLEGFLHGLFHFDDLFAAGGLRVTDTANGTTLLPGCCSGLGEWRDWLKFVDAEGFVDLGHDPHPTARLSGESVRLTVDSDDESSPTIDLTAAELRPLLAGVERDLAGFLRLASAWTEQHLPDHSVPVIAALARALDMPSPP